MQITCSISRNDIQGDMNANIVTATDTKIRVASLSQTINAVLRGSNGLKWFFLAFRASGPANNTLQDTGFVQVIGADGDDSATSLDATSIVRTEIPHSFFNGRMISPDLLASSVTGALPNGRETWTSAGQVVEDVIAGRVLSKSTGALAAAFNPFGLFVDQVAETITVLTAPNPTTGFQYNGDKLTLVEFDLIRSSSPDWFE